MINKKSLFSVLLLFSLVTVSVQSTDEIIIAMNAWEPIKSERAPYGVLAQIAKEAFALEGVDVVYQVLPWKRGYDSVKKGLIHGIVGWNYTEDREPFFIFSTPLLLEDMVFFHHRDLIFDWSSVSDLHGMSIGLIQGYNYGTELPEAVEQGLIEGNTADSDETCIRMLSAGRFDLWPGEVDVALHLINKILTSEQASELIFHPHPLLISDLRLLLSKAIPENQRYMDLFEKGFSKLRESGRLRKIVEEFLPGSQSLKYIE